MTTTDTGQGRGGELRQTIRTRLLTDAQARFTTLPPGIPQEVDAQVDAILGLVGADKAAAVKEARLDELNRVPHPLLHNRELWDYWSHRKAELNDQPDVDAISLCNGCHCMTHTVNGRCGKCNALKADRPAEDIHQRIKQLLADGQLVRSLALGRVGDITAVDDHPSGFQVTVRGPRGSTSATTFRAGDPVELRQEPDGSWVIVNVWPAEDGDVPSD